MSEITPEQREAALAVVAEAFRSSAIREGATNKQAFKAILDALIANGWGPVTDAEARGYRAGVEDAARACDAVACDDKGFGEGGRDAARCCSNRIRWLIYHDKPKETPHG